MLGMTLGHVWGHFGSCLALFGLTLGQVWDDFGACLGLLWGMFGVSLGRVWVHPGPSFGQFWAGSGDLLGHIRTIIFHNWRQIWPKRFPLILHLRFPFGPMCLLEITVRFRNPANVEVATQGFQMLQARLPRHTLPTESQGTHKPIGPNRSP